MPGTQQAIIGATALCALAAGASAAPVRYACDLSHEGATLRLTFDLDPASFAPAVDPNEPPRREISRVSMEGETFEAEAVWMENSTRGFHAPDRGLMLTVARTSTAWFSDAAGTDWRGHCRREM